MGCPPSAERRARVENGSTKEKDFQTEEAEAEDPFQGRARLPSELPAVWRSQAVPPGLPHLWILPG